MHSSALAALWENDECQECSSAPLASPPAATVSQPLAASTGLSSTINIYQSVHAEGITAAPLLLSPRMSICCGCGVHRRLTLVTPPGLLQPRCEAYGHAAPRGANLSVSPKHAFSHWGTRQGAVLVNEGRVFIPPSEESEETSRKERLAKVFPQTHPVGPPWPSSETAGKKKKIFISRRKGN